jgi:hypothetical protein
MHHMRRRMFGAKFQREQSAGFYEFPFNDIWPPPQTFATESRGPYYEKRTPNDANLSGTGHCITFRRSCIRATASSAG